jgi:protein Mpv17
VTSIFSVFWQSYLSWLNSSAGEGKGKPTCNSGSSV